MFLEGILQNKVTQRYFQRASASSIHISARKAIFVFVINTKNFLDTGMHNSKLESNVLEAYCMEM